MLIVIEPPLMSNAHERMNGITRFPHLFLISTISTDSRNQENELEIMCSERRLP